MGTCFGLLIPMHALVPRLCCLPFPLQIMHVPQAQLDPGTQRRAECLRPEHPEDLCSDLRLSLKYIGLSQTIME